MSAFMVPKRHIDFLITAGLEFGNSSPLRWGRSSEELIPETASEFGSRLWAENRASVNYRYSEDEEANPYEYERFPGRIDPVQVLKAIACYEYQSCEHPEWEGSDAKIFCDHLRKMAIGQLPKYKEAEWVIR